MRAADYKVIDFHTHIFPDSVAERAISALNEGTPDKAVLNGTKSSLLMSMDNAGIERSVCLNILTKPLQFQPVLDFCKSVRSKRLIPFPSVHPDDPAAVEHLKIIKEEGFKGIKLHPYYQKFNLDEEKMFPIYEALIEQDLLLLSHTGFDIAFDRVSKAGPEQILNVISRYPELKLITSHTGGWESWGEVASLLMGRPVYMDLSYSLTPRKSDTAAKILKEHSSDYILFGSDSPWTDQAETIYAVKELGLKSDKLEKIFYSNAAVLLDIQV